MAVVASVMLSATASLAEVTGEVKIDKHTVAYLRTRINTIYHSKNVDRDDVYCTTRYKKVFKTASVFADECDEIFLDYDHWTNSQDDSDFSYQIGKISNMTDSTAIVTINAKNFGKRYNVVLSMRYERDDWFVDDFILTDGSGESEATAEYISYRIFYQQFSLHDLLYLTQYYYEKEKAEKSGLYQIYHDSVSDEEMAYDEYVYGRDIYKGAKQGIGYQIIKDKPHAFYFSMSLDTSTNGRLYFATEDDANRFYDRASRTKPFNFEDKRISVKKQADGESFLVQELFDDMSPSTIFAIHRPVQEGEFYMIEVEIYV